MYMYCLLIGYVKVKQKLQTVYVLAVFHYGSTEYKIYNAIVAEHISHSSTQ